MATRFVLSVSGALLATSALVSPLQAQTAPASVTSPTFRQIDDNGVDLVRGDFVAQFIEGSIGSGEAKLSLQHLIGSIGYNGSDGASQWDHILLRRLPAYGTFVDFGQRNDKFPGAESRGSSLTVTAGVYKYTTPDGTTIAFEPQTPVVSSSNVCDGSQSATMDCQLFPTSMTSPNGRVITLGYEYWSKCVVQTPSGQNPSPDDPTNCTYTPRLASVSNNYGYSISFSYASSAGGGTSDPPISFTQRTGAGFYNNSKSSAPLASVSYAAPSAGVTNVTDIGGRVWRTTATSIRRPGASTDTTAYSVSGGVVTSAVRDGVTTQYTRSVNGNTITMVASNAAGATTVVSDAAIGRPTSVTDALNHTTGYQYDPSGRLKRVTQPEQNSVEYTLDARGNATTTTAVGKGGSGSIATLLSYDTTCSNTKTCNQPNSTTDALGRTTNYTYDSTHGGVLTVTAPAPLANAVQPQQRYSYTLLNGEYLLTGVSACQTSSSCVGQADEVKATAGYDANGNLTSVSSGDGTGALTATRTMGYDDMGNLLTVDGPLAGAADTTRYRYNAARELVGVISADPDGGGALKPRAVRYSYDGSGQPYLTQYGSVTDQSDSAWNAFAEGFHDYSLYDPNGRIIRKTRSASGVDKAVGDTIYDALGRPTCSVTYMDPSVWGPQAINCAPLQTSGSNGPDRVSKVSYDALGRLTEARVGVGTASEAVQAAYVYSDNGKLSSLTDGENNKTSYVYDPFDRLSQTIYPSPSKGAGTSNGGDYEQLTYDAGSNITARRLRDGQSIGYSYDALNRLYQKTIPNEVVVTYGYDNLSRVTSIMQPGYAMSFSYDALSRQVAENEGFGSMTRQYDLAGSLIGTTWWGGFHVDYDRLVTGDLLKVRENGASSGVGVLATFGYDDLGQRTSLTRGNGTVTGYSYDGVSRLTGLSQDLAGAASDLTLGFTYNPASQIASTSRSNDAYAWTGLGNVSHPYAHNGLNQMTVSGVGTQGFDARGNLTTSAGSTYGYSAENMLKSAPNVINTGETMSLYYDALHRLVEYDRPNVGARRFVFDGTNVAAEVNSGGAVQHRYVWGDGADELLVDYDLTASDQRRFAHADERGSVIALSDSSGNKIQINTYDEYGLPAASNKGWFQYTGQAWLPEVGMHNYKERIYSPALGRFMQTDPIGYGDGPNMYNYVKSDAVNLVDPSGTHCIDGTADNGGDCKDNGGLMGPITVGGSGPSNWAALVFGHDNGNSGLAGGYGGLFGKVTLPSLPSPPQKAIPCSGFAAGLAKKAYGTGSAAETTALNGGKAAAILGVVGQEELALPLAALSGSLGAAGGVLKAGASLYYFYYGNPAPLAGTIVGQVLNKVMPFKSEGARAEAEGVGSALTDKAVDKGDEEQICRP